MAIPYVTLYCTAPSESEALSLVRLLLDRHLIACANVFPKMTSLYRWNDELQQETEVAFLMKTTEEQASEAITLLEREHSYETPCITKWPIVGGSAAYLDWLRGEATGDASC